MKAISTKRHQFVAANKGDIIHILHDFEGDIPEYQHRGDPKALARYVTRCRSSSPVKVTLPYAHYNCNPRESFIQPNTPVSIDLYVSLCRRHVGTDNVECKVSNN